MGFAFESEEHIAAAKTGQPHFIETLPSGKPMPPGPVDIKVGPIVLSTFAPPSRALAGELFHIS